MENNYLLAVLGLAIVAGAYLAYRLFAKKYPEKKEVYRAKLLYFDEDSWYCHIDYGTYIGRGFVSLPQEGHFIGEEVEVEPEGDEFIENFIPVNSDK
jgi:hypothetical protein